IPPSPVHRAVVVAEEFPAWSVLVEPVPGVAASRVPAIGGLLALYLGMPLPTQTDPDHRRTGEILSGTGPEAVQGHRHRDLVVGPRGVADGEDAVVAQLDRAHGPVAHLPETVHRLCLDLQRLVR